MASKLPALAHTWQTDVNNTIIGDNTQDAANVQEDRKELMLTLKNSLIGFGSNPWTVTRSCDSSTVSASDLWSATSDIIWSNGPLSNGFSWIVLHNSAMGIYLLIALDCIFLNNGITIHVACSRNAFTGGSTTTFPVSTDVMYLIGDTTFIPGGSSNWKEWGTGLSAYTDRQYVLSVLHSNDGEHTRIFIWHGGSLLGLWAMDKPALPSGGWTNPFTFMHLTLGLDSGLMDFDEIITEDYNFVAYFPVKAHNGTTVNRVNLHMLLPTSNTGTTQEEMAGLYTANHPLSGNKVGYAHRVISEDDEFQTWNHKPADMWHIPTTVTAGDSFPASGSTHQFVAMGGLLFPWDGANAPTLT